MPKFELTKSIEAVKLNPRTLRPLSQLKHTVPYGAVVEKITPNRDMLQFNYLGEPFEAPESDLKPALRELS